eukprot:TRINITY_DN727_c0_g1_i1.p1 TRINITY_DN727_c0_g1~~TRINITY_DN727_c0_g1_i1.p1  ORF type:complete len:488 (-),score=127.86 TRINITY_DN727_c0_g1_i1:175-1638(-)
MSRIVQDYDRIYQTKLERRLRIRWMESRDPEDQPVPEYDLDSEDERWLPSISSKCRGVTEPELKTAFEFAFDKMEKLIRETKKMPAFEDAEKVISPYLKPGVLKDVYDYFIEKRQRVGVSMIRRFQIPRTHSGAPIGVTTRGGAARRKILHQNDVEGYMRLQELRDDFVRAREIMDALKRREKLKKEALEQTRGIFELNVKESQMPKPPPGTVDANLKIKLREKAKVRAKKEREASRAKARLERRGKKGAAGAGGSRRGSNATSVSGAESSSSSMEIVSEYYSSEMSDPPERETFYDNQYAQYQRERNTLFRHPGQPAGRATQQFRVARGGRVMVDWVPDTDAYERGYNDDEVIIGWDSLLEARYLDEHAVPTTSTFSSLSNKPYTDKPAAMSADTGKQPSSAIGQGLAEPTDMPVSAMIFKRRAMLQAQNKEREEQEAAQRAVAAVAASEAGAVPANAAVPMDISAPHPAAAAAAAGGAGAPGNAT